MLKDYLIMHLWMHIIYWSLDLTLGYAFSKDDMAPGLCGAEVSNTNRFHKVPWVSTILSKLFVIASRTFHGVRIDTVGATNYITIIICYDRSIIQS